MRVYSLFDRKVKEFGALAVASNDAAVKRALREAFSQGPSLLSKYPNDFDLFCLGRFDPDTGVLIPEAAPLLVDNCGVVLSNPPGGED